MKKTNIQSTILVPVLAATIVVSLSSSIMKDNYTTVPVMVNTSEEKVVKEFSEHDFRVESFLVPHIYYSNFNGSTYYDEIIAKNPHGYWEYYDMSNQEIEDINVRMVYNYYKDDKLVNVVFTFYLPKEKEVPTYDTNVYIDGEEAPLESIV